MLSDALRRRLPAEAIGVGCMIGTSLDGLDVAILRFGDPPTFLGGGSWPLRQASAARLRAIAEGGSTTAAELAALGVALAADHHAAIDEALLGQGLERADFVGAHGVTLSHRPEDDWPHSFQLLDGAALAVRMRCPVLCDFRSADVAMGGLGAPLAPIVDALRRDANEDRAILNLGGIANVSLLPADPSGRILAADVGPANMPLDELWRWGGGDGEYDDGGRCALGGDVDEAVCATVLAESWVRAPLPRSFGREQFGSEWTARLREQMKDRALADQLRSVVEIEARAFAIFLRELAGNWCTRPERPFRLLLTGGGRHHAALCDALRVNLPDATVEAIESIGVDGDLKEAIDFAWLAWMRLQQRKAPSELSSAHLGCLHFPLE